MVFKFSQVFYFANKIQKNDKKETVMPVFILKNPVFEINLSDQGLRVSFSRI
jgi:hypothetical protein